MLQQYTNERTPDVLVCQNVSPFRPEQLAEMGGDARALIKEQKTVCRQHPVTAIYRIATDGSLIRDGGIVRAVDAGHQLMLCNGSYANMARVGYEVVYPDGRQRS